MAKRKASSRKSAASASGHSLPSGFWAQVGALLMIALAILLVITWFNSGGPVLTGLKNAMMFLFGYSMYLIPLLLVYLAVYIFRDEDNKIPVVITIASILMIIWFSGVFSLFTNSAGDPTGGVIGTFIDKGMLKLVDKGVAIFVYVLLILITALFVLSVSPITVIKKISNSLKSTKVTEENDHNTKVMKKVVESSKAPVDDPIAPSGKKEEFKLNAGVPIMEEADKKAAKKNQKAEAPEPKTALVAISDPNWEMPSIDLLEKQQSPADAGDVKQNAEIIKNTLREFNINVEMEGANVGPKVTQFTLRPPSGVKLTRITALEKNIELNLAAKHIRMEAPIPGQRAVGIEVPNIKAADVRLYGILDSKQWKKAAGKLNFAIGRDISGQAVVEDLGDMPHLLIAGQTKSGKSVMINTLLCSLLYRNSPSDLKMILVDPKLVELSRYKDIPHLLTPVITEPEKTVSALKWAVNEMERRYSLLAEEGVVNIDEYNQKMAKAGRKIAIADEDGNVQEHNEGKMPFIVIVIDELADLMMMAAKDLESLIVRLAQKARAVGVHLVLATQSPRADIITGLIKANIPAKIAFTVNNQIESRIIMDQTGAEKLLGKGDMLLLTSDMPQPRRIQGAWVTNDEVIKIADSLRLQSPPQYNDEIISQPVNLNGKGGVVMDFNGGGDGDEFRDAVKVVLESKKASASLLQRRLRFGYAKAARLIDEMEDRGIVGPADGARPREVLISSLDEIDN